MSEQENIQATAKSRRSRWTQKQNGAQPPPLPLPANENTEAWKAYWKVQGQPWRTEPEIDAERQKYLAERRAIVPDIENGIYPFRDIKLSRADVEWLLATHENGQGPVDWKDENQRDREGLDLRGADLREANLRKLPLANILGGLTYDEWTRTHKEQRQMAAVFMEGAHLFNAQIQGAILGGAHLERTDLKGAHLEGAFLRWAHLDHANLFSTRLENSHLVEAHLVEANMRGAFLSGVRLNKVILGNEKHIGPQLVDVRWGAINLAIVNWSQVEILGDEYKAQQKIHAGKVKDKDTRLVEYEIAVRANRQLANQLQTQGLNEVAARFAYRAQLLQRKVFWYQQIFGQYLFSLFLDLLAGYGYKPWRSFIAYLLVITAFATAYFIIGHTVGPVLSPLGSVVFSMTSFHGRGFFPGGIALDDPLTVLAALEAFVGLLIEVTFIATLTQRLFSK